MKSLYLFILVATFSNTGAYAQAKFALEGGVNFPKGIITNEDVNNNTTHEKTEFGIGCRAGVKMEYPLSEDFYFDPGLYYVTNGYKTKDNNDIFNTIQLPLCLTFKTGGVDYSGLVAGFGPYIAYNGKAKADFHYGDMARTDLGVDLNIGYQVGSSIFFNVRGQAGFSNLYTSPYNKVRTSNIGVNIGCFFGGRQVKKHNHKHKLPQTEDDTAK